MQEQERRQYFRIEQEVSLELKVVTENEIINHSRPTQFDVSPNFLLLSELQEIDAESSHLLRKIAEKDSNVSSFLKIIHEKVERLAQAIASTEMKISNAAIQEVNLSEGGVQFNSDFEITAGKFLSIKLIFPESCIGLLLFAQSCRCDELENGDYQVGVEFIKMPESCRMVLARQILESQARLRQRKTDQEEVQE